jgi:hypothetical protein
MEILRNAAMRVARAASIQPAVRCPVFLICSRSRMTDTDPETPEWTIAWTIKRALRLHLGPRHSYVPSTIAREVLAALRLAKWRISKEPPDPPHATPGE